MSKLPGVSKTPWKILGRSTVGGGMYTVDDLLRCYLAWWSLPTRLALDGLGPKTSNDLGRSNAPRLALEILDAKGIRGEESAWVWKMFECFLIGGSFSWLRMMMMMMMMMMMCWMNVEVMSCWTYRIDLIYYDACFIPWISSHSARPLKNAQTQP